MSETRVGLRIDVDTLRGTRDGVPALVKLFDKYNIKATFYMSVGPDNMGRHFWRLLKPRFFMKMLRSNAGSLYGYDILLRGTAWPGPLIGKRLPDIIRLPHQTGHETGLHAWDHYSWQTHIDRYSSAQLLQHVRLGFDTLTDILGEKPQSSASAGWRCNEQALLAKEQMGFAYNGDCRGTSIFTPVVEGRALAPQIPVTLPAYDELIGTGGITDGNYNDAILSRCMPDRLNVYTIHAEVEGIAKLGLFEAMLQQARAKNIRFVPTKELLAQATQPIPKATMIKQELEGREGWLAWQGKAIA